MVEVRKTYKNNYDCLFGDKAYDIFLTAEFNEINKHKVENIEYLTFYEGRDILGGIICGLFDKKILSPFSAPYGGLRPAKNLSKSEIVAIAEAFKTYLDDNGLSCRITFPAPIDEDFVVKANDRFRDALYGTGFDVFYEDINYHIDINTSKPDRDVLRRARMAKKIGCTFMASKFSEVRMIDIYNVIYKNHIDLGYPMAMSLDDYIDISKTADIYLFSVALSGEMIAGAICYRTRKGILQPTGWGDNVSMRKTCPGMSFLAAELIFWIKENVKDIRVLDLGPSSKHGIINNGLCRFKESLGGAKTIKTTLEYLNICK